MGASSATVCNLNQKNRKKRKQKIATERSLRIIDSIDGIISRDNNSPSRSPFIYTTTTVQLSVRAEFLVSHRFSLLYSLFKSDTTHLYLYLSLSLSLSRGVASSNGICFEEKRKKKKKKKTTPKKKKKKKKS